MTTSSIKQWKEHYGQRIIRGAIWGQTGKILESGLTLAFLIIIVRKLGPSDYGRYGLITSVVMFGMIFTSFGINEILGSRIPSLLAKEKGNTARRLISAMIVSRLGLTVVAIIVIYLARGFLSSVFNVDDFSNAVSWVALLMLFSGLGELFQTIFTVVLDTRFVAINRTIGMALSVVIAIVLFACYGPSVTSAIIATIAGWASVIVAASIKLVVQVSQWEGGTRKIPPVVRYGLTVWGGNIVNFGLTVYASNILLGVLATNSSEIGYFNSAVLPVGRVWTVMVAGLATIILPTLSESVTRFGNEGLAKAWNVYLSTFVLLLVPAFSLLLFYAKPLVGLVYGDQYLSAVSVMQVYLLFVMAGTLFGGTVTINLFYSTGKQYIVLMTSAIGGTVNVALMALMIPKMGAMGAVVAGGIANIVTGAMLYGYLRREITIIKYPTVFVCKITGAVLLGFTAGRILIPTETIIEGIVSMITGALVVIIICAMLKPLKHNDLRLLQVNVYSKWLSPFISKI